MEYVACNFCGSDNASLVHTLRDIRLGLPGEFTLVRCDKCGLRYLNPRPDWKELAAYYPAEYQPYIAVAGQRAPWIDWAEWFGLDRRCRAITRRRPEGQLLDVGCATGRFLDEMHRHGRWEVYGVELVSLAAEYARQRFGLDVFCGTLTEAAYASDRFDVVTMWDVLEHVADPTAQLLEVLRILKPGGLMVLRIPDPLSWEAQCFGPTWVGYDAPRHLFGFPRHILTHQLAGLGFERVSSECLTGTYYSFAASLGFWLTSRRMAGLGWLAHKASKSTAVRIVTAPVFLVLRALSLASSMTYFAWKPVGGRAR